MTTTATTTGAMPGRSTTGWWDVGTSRLLVHRHDPDGDVHGVVVVVEPPSNEGLTTHRTERTLAARLVAAGRAVVRVGLSDASPSVLTVPDDRPLVARWEDEVAGVLREAAGRYGVEHVDVVGVRLAATLAGNAARRPDVPVRTAVLLAPVGTGRLYLRSMGQLLAIAAEAGGQPRPFPTEPDGGVALFGHTLDAASAEHLRRYALATDDLAGVDVHVVAGADKALDKASRSLVEAGAVHHPIEGLASMLDRVSSYALVPTAILDEVTAVLLAGAPVADPRPAPEPDPTSAVVATTPHEIRCEVVEVGGMPGLVVRPPEIADRVLVWSPGATEPSDGPTGLWMTMARRLAARGVTTVVFDLEDSGERTRPDVRVDIYPYEHRRVRELADGVAWVHRTYGVLPDLGGLCAGGWLAVAAAALVPVRTVIPVNIEQWVNDPDVIERIEADPEHGLPASMRATAAGAATGGQTAAMPEAGPGGSGLPVTAGLVPFDRAVLERRLRLGLKSRLPYRARLELGRRGAIQAPEPFIERATRSGAAVRALLTRRDLEVFVRLHGYEALARLVQDGRDVVVEADSCADHGLVLPYTRRRVMAFVERVLVGTDVFY